MKSSKTVSTRYGPMKYGPPYNGDRMGTQTCLSGCSRTSTSTTGAWVAGNISMITIGATTKKGRSCHPLIR